MKLKIFSVFLLLQICLTMFFSSFPIYGSTDGFWEDISFFGDSTTHGMIRYIVENDGRLGTPYTHLRRDQILTSPDGTFYLRNLPTTRISYKGQTLSLAEAIGSSAPKILIVTVGVNGLLHWEREAFAELYNRLLDLFEKASPDSKIVLQSVYPTAKNRAAHLAAFTVDKVDRLNSWIMAIADERGLLYINTADALKDDDGWLRSDYQNGDGLHLNTAGFNCVLASIESALKKER